VNVIFDSRVGVSTAHGHGQCVPNFNCMVVLFRNSQICSYYLHEHPAIHMNYMRRAYDAVLKSVTVVLGMKAARTRLTTLPQFVGPCRRRVWSTSTPLCRIEPFADSAVQTVNHRRSSVSGRRSTVLEQSARQRQFSQSALEKLKHTQFQQ